MTIDKTAMFAAITLAASAAAGMASAEITIANVGVGNGDWGDVSVAGYGHEWATPILLTDTNNKNYFVYCVDLDHVVYVAGGQALPYHIGLVQHDGLGRPISETLSDQLGRLEELGKHYYGLGNEDAAVAAQAAIWQLEYGGVSVTNDPSHPELLTFYNEFINIAPSDHPTWATGLISDGGTQSFVMGGVPEPSTWAVAMVGVALLGAALRRRATLAAA